MRSKTLAAVGAVLTLTVGFTQADPLGTAFTYQGRLNDTNGPVSGLYEFEFKLYDDATAGSQLGSDTKPQTPVSNGLFTVTVDFGSSVFVGEARWLQIGLRTNRSDPFTILSPRQLLTPSPYSLYAPLAGSAAAATTAITATTATNAISVSSNAVTAESIASGQVVKSLNALHDTVTLSAGTNINLVAVGNDLRISATPGTVVTNAGWGVMGNSGITNGNFLGTLDGQALELRVNNTRALRIVPTTDTPNLIGGYSGNSVAANLVGVTIGGGGTVLGTQPNIVTNNGQYGTIAGGYHNTVTNYGGAVLGGSVHLAGGYFAAIGAGQAHTNLGDYSWIGGGQYNAIQTGAGASTIAGGYHNTIQTGATYATVGGGFLSVIGTDASYSTIAGGQNGSIGSGAIRSTVSGGYGNTIGASAERATIAGGSANTVKPGAYGAVISGGDDNAVQTNAYEAVVGGGSDNQVSGYLGTIGGGTHNRVSGPGGTIPGGNQNSAIGFDTFAAGTHAKANHDGAFVWADNNYVDFSSTSSNQFLIRASGGLGINTTAPQTDLSVAGGMNIDQASLNSGTATNILSFGSASGEGIGSKRTSGGNRFGLDFYTGYSNRMTIANSGFVGIGTLAPQTMLHVNGEATVQVLTITGGADVAEPFDIASPDVPTGAVVVIDAEQPGKLKISDRAYDTRVAGVVSGAKGIHPGLSLRQAGALSGGRNVALTGRVYVQADASGSPIQPGDLLTTSDMPGYAMKVADHARAQGAVLGKAMTGLSDGTGLILVLVTLQ